MKGLIHIYCGDGKGKTTAALGAAVRAAGRGRRVLISRFLKTEDSGEVVSLSLLPGITLMPCFRNFGFSWQMSPETRKEAELYYGRSFKEAWRVAAGKEGGDGYDLLILDEVIGAVNLGFVDEMALIAALKERPEALEVILTGRNPSEALCSYADYLTEMKLRKHPFTEGIAARKGIEY